MADTLDTIAMRLDLQALDDDALQKAIEDQEALINCMPSMESMLLPALRQWRAERDRRLDATVGVVLGNERVVADSEDEANIATGRSKRVRHATDHYGRVGSTKCPTLHEQMRKHPEFGASVEQFEQNKAVIKRQALELACPLLVADEVARGNYSENDLKCLLRTQMKQVAVAGDGYQYDFVRIKEYIREHIGQRLVSPVTGEPMIEQVCFTLPIRNRFGNVVYVGTGKEKLPKLETMTWRPPLNPLGSSGPVAKAPKPIGGV